MGLNPQLLALGLQMQRQREQDRAARERQDQQSLVQAFQLQAQGFKADDILTALPGLPGNFVPLLRSREKQLRQQEKQDIAGAAAPKLGAQAGAAAAGTADLQGNFGPLPRDSQGAVGVLLRDALLAASQSEDPLASRGAVESGFLRAQQGARATERAAAATKRREQQAAEATERATLGRLDQKDAFALRDDLRRESGKFMQGQATIRKAINLADRARRGDAVAQQRLIVLVEKSTDEESVVREGEFDRTGTAVRIADRIQLLLKSQGTERLTPELVDDIMANMALLYQAGVDNQRALQNEFIQSARDFGATDKQVRAIEGRIIDPRLVERVGQIDTSTVFANPNAVNSPAAGPPKTGKFTPFLK